MIVLSFNTRGVGGLLKRKKIRELVKEQRVDFLAIQQTKKEVITEALCRNLWGDDNFRWAFLPSVGNSGGILSIWRKSKSNLIYSFVGEGIVGVCLEWGPLRRRCLVVNVYSKCDLVGKQRLWEKLVWLRNSLGVGAWCLIGDFNFVLHPEERRGVNEVPRGLYRREIELFNEVVEVLEVEDVSLVARKFTWYNSNGIAMSRIDRAFISDEWREFWGNVSLWSIPRDVSDHCPLVLKGDSLDWGPKPFRFKNHWLENRKFKRVVEEAWRKYGRTGWMGVVFRSKLKGLKWDIREWNKVEYGNVEIEELDGKCDHGVLSIVEVVERKHKFEELWRLWNSKEFLLIQRAKSKWLKEGDANSKFFHCCVKSRMHSNGIKALKVNNEWVFGVNEIRGEVVDYFKRQVARSDWERPRLNGVNFASISEEDNVFLVAPFSLEEIECVVKESDGNKSPGPDGFNFAFLKQFWYLIKHEVRIFFDQFHGNEVLAKCLLSYFITLIPKVKSSSSLKEFRPISLLGCLYKILAKVLAGRLAKVMNSVISKYQSTFLKGRKLVDGVLIVNEVVELTKLRNRECLILKVDFEKAYDSVEVDIQRGLKQGDPLAPFLFLLVAEGFSGLMENAVNRNLFKGFEVKRGGTVISHLQYADDTLCIGEASIENLWTLKALLRGFEMVSGLKVNFNKSCLMGVNVSADFLEMASNFLHWRVGSVPFMYLGLPVGANPRKLSTWEPVLDQIRLRLSTWGNKYISLGGRIVLLNSVINSIPIFYLSFLKMPAKVVKKVVGIQRRFLWSGVGGQKKICWVKWKTVCQS